MSPSDQSKLAATQTPVKDYQLKRVKNLRRLKIIVKIIVIGDPNTSNKNIQSGYRNRIWHRKMCHSYNERWEKTNDRRNRTLKLRKNLNTKRICNILTLDRAVNQEMHLCK